MKRILLSLLTGYCLSAAADCQSTPLETSEPNAARLKWFREARFGMFIHWGVYAAPAGEWKGKQVHGVGEWIMKFAEIPIAEYKPLAKQFTASQPAKLNLTASKGSKFLTPEVVLNATPSGQTWQIVDFGKVSIPAGDASITLQPDIKGWKGINLRRFFMTPE